MNYTELVSKQRNYFYTGATRTYEARADALRRLRSAILAFEPKINEAILADLNKQPFETYMCETGLVLDEIRFHLKHLRGWMREKRVSTPLTQFAASSFISPEPYGVALIMTPWNYPIQLCFEPLIGAISGGNCAVIKPSIKTPATSHVISELIASAFSEEQIAVVEGGRAETGALLSQKWDYMFFTGSVAVGKEVMAAAAANLTPVSLELGGKSPVIVDATANLSLAARRIAFGKVLNAGQTCVEPDYLLIHESVRDQFVEEYRKALKEFFPKNDMSEMVHIVSDQHFSRICGLIQGENAVVGGKVDPSLRFVEPTVLVDVKPESPIMQEEIFGPVLPILTWTDINWCIDFIRSRPKPLALYIFTKDKWLERRVLDTCSFGGGCVNDTIVHLANPRMGFGGVGESGMGQYHGKKSFETFSHYRSIMDKKLWFDMPLRYFPYRKSKFKILKMFLH